MSGPGAAPPPGAAHHLAVNQWGRSLLVDELSSKAPVTLVGYGVQEQIVAGGPPVWAGLRVRLMAPARLVSGSFTHSEEFVRVTASPGQGGGTRFGDIESFLD